MIGLYRLSYLHRASKRTGLTGRRARCRHAGFDVGPITDRVSQSAFVYRNGVAIAQCDRRARVDPRSIYRPAVSAGRALGPWSMMTVMDGEETLEVLEAVQRRAAALAQADADVLRELLHRNFRWTSHSGQRFDRRTYIGNNTGGAVVWRQQTMTDVDVVISNDTAVVVATVTDEVNQGGVPRSYRMPMTQTWVRQDRRWRCLAGHAGSLL